MRDLRTRDLNDVLAVGHMALECNSLDELQNDTLYTMQRSINAASSVYLHMTSDGRTTRFRGEKAHGHPESEMTKWCQQYQPQDPFVRRYLEEIDDNASKIVVSSEIIEEREYIASNFYNNFLRPMSIYHVMLVGLSSARVPFGILGFHRPKEAPAFSAREIAMAELMAPHLGGAIQKARVLERVDERDWIINAISAETLYNSIIVLDGNLKPIYASESASELMRSAVYQSQTASLDTLSLPSTLIQKSRQLMRVLSEKSDISELQNFSLQIGPNEQPINVHLRPMECGVDEIRIMVCFESSSSQKKPHVQLKQYGLTPRQIDIAQLVGVGLTNAEIATQLCISIRTVENHLRTVYEKAGVNNRTSLAYRMVNHIG